MKKAMLILMIAIAGLATGCGKKDKKAPIANAEMRAAGATGNLATDVVMNGGIYQGSLSSDAFQYTVQGFVNALIPEDYLGFVNGDFNDTSARTGIVFGGRVAPAGGRITQSGAVGGRVSITANSPVAVLVYDEYVGSADPESGTEIGPVPFDFTESSGYVEGTRAYLKFWNSRTTLMMEGDIGADGNFIAQVKYENKVRYDGSGEGGVGGLGWAIVRTCAFFVCN